MIEVKSPDCTNGTPAPNEIAQSLNLLDCCVNGDILAEPDENVFGYPSFETTAIESCANAAVGNR